MGDKVIALIDMDCFYVQVESRENPELQGKPAAVVQYKSWKGGGIIAVNYEARAKGVTRQMRGDEAREKCPDIELVRVPEVREKADLTKYRNAGREVIQVLVSFGCIVERASIDEAYVDLTSIVESRFRRGENVKPEDLQNTHIGGSTEDREQSISDWIQEAESQSNEADLKLAIGASLIEEMRAEVFAKTKFRCSAGIAHCKTLAKLCCGLNKPNKQTVLPHSSVPLLYSTLNITKVRGLGGKLGYMVTDGFQIQTMGQLAQLSHRDLLAKFDEKTASWLHLLGRGFDNEPVKERELPKSIGCSKNFRGPDVLDTKEKVQLRLRNLVEELAERLEVDKEEHCRIAKGLTVGCNLENQGYISRAGQISSYNLESLYRTGLALLSKLNTADINGSAWTPKLHNISISASKFEDMRAIGTRAITSFFKKQPELDQSKDIFESFLDESSDFCDPTEETQDELGHDSIHGSDFPIEVSVSDLEDNDSFPCDKSEKSESNFQISNHKHPAASLTPLTSKTPEASKSLSSANGPEPGKSFFRWKMQQMKEQKEKEELARNQYIKMENKLTACDATMNKTTPIVNDTTLIVTETIPIAKDSIVNATPAPAYGPEPGKSFFKWKMQQMKEQEEREELARRLKEEEERLERGEPEKSISEEMPDERNSKKSTWSSAWKST
ncbi:DNA polymerase eta isoform X3 [Eurytemora carolleeae]|uniref:DNA polymerase eta isoform X3 n=1 Tax=Eurytemora carolleeae TaxID=1294199 RepID=UPI000C78A8C0|nr:DNA polymerase eta isoform X3 [Eurytemora carolleeae]|eukprot:XP_023344540.1 DNA polymerase eta-like isoform X3 [Eurytemora affinis]